MGASVLLVDFRGSGGSSESYSTLGWLEAEDVAPAMAFARRHLPHSRLVLYGQSMGSAAILRAIHAHDVRPDAVILESVFDGVGYGSYAAAHPDAWRSRIADFLDLSPTTPPGDSP